MRRTTSAAIAFYNEVSLVKLMFPASVWAMFLTESLFKSNKLPSVSARLYGLDRCPLSACGRSFSDP